MAPHVRNQRVLVQVEVEDVVLSSAPGGRRSARPENTLYPRGVSRHQRNGFESRGRNPRDLTPMSQLGGRNPPFTDICRVHRIGLELVSEDPPRPPLEDIVRPGLTGALFEGRAQVVCKAGKGSIQRTYMDKPLRNKDLRIYKFGNISLESPISHHAAPSRGSDRGSDRGSE